MNISINSGFLSSAGMVTGIMPAAVPAQLAPAEVQYYLDQFSDCHSTIPPQHRLYLYRRIAPHLRSAQVERLLKVGELWKYFKALSAEDFAEKPDEIQAAAKGLIDQVYPIINLYTEDGLLPIFAFAWLKNRIRENGRAKKDEEKKDGAAIQIDFDVSFYNHKLDSTGSLVDMLIPALSNWFVEKIRDNPKIHKLFGRSPAVVRSPQRTSFVIVGSNAQAGKRLVRLVQEELSHMEHDIRIKIKKAQEEGGDIPSTVDLNKFNISATIHFSTINLTRVEGVDLSSESGAASHIMSELRRVAAETKYLKDSAPAAKPAWIHGGLVMYGSDALPHPGEATYESLKVYLDKGLGFVPFGQYGHEGVKDPESRALDEFPDFPHDVGKITRPRKLRASTVGYSKRWRFYNAGEAEIFWLMISEFISKPGDIREKDIYDFRQALDGFVLFLIDLGETARRFSRFPLTLKAKREWKGERADFFLEQASQNESLFGVRYDSLAAIEIDDGKVFGETYPPNFVDSDFQKIKDIAFDVAKELRLYPVVIAAEGDQVRMAFSTATLDGGRRDNAEIFLKRYQEMVRQHFAGKLFQPRAKVITERGLKRLPVWVNKNGTFIVSENKPDGFEAYEKSLTVTIAYANMPSLVAEDSGVRANGLVRQMFGYIDTDLKKQRGQYVKEGFGKLPV